MQHHFSHQPDHPSEPTPWCNGNKVGFPQPPTPNPQPRRAPHGFTLSEVLVALGILALGTIAVASLFPTAAFLQKEAVKQTLQQNHIRSADAVLEGVGINNTMLLEFIELIETEPAGYPAYAARNTIDDPAYDVFALAEIDITIGSSYDDPAITPAVDQGATPDMTFDGVIEIDDSFIYDDDVYINGNFPDGFRTLPTITPGGYYGPTARTEFREREVMWVPLVRAGLEASEIYPDWNVYLFILQPDSQLRAADAYTPNAATYPDFVGLVCANPLDGGYFPKVFRVPVTWDSATPNRATPSVNLYGHVKPGEKILGDNGVIYRVSQIDPGTGTMILAEDTEYAPINQRDLGAVWVAPAPGGINENSPLADIRLLSNTVVRTNDY